MHAMDAGLRAPPETAPPPVLGKEWSLRLARPSDAALRRPFFMLSQPEALRRR